MAIQQKHLAELMSNHNIYFKRELGKIISEQDMIIIYQSTDYKVSQTNPNTQMISNWDSVSILIHLGPVVQSVVCLTSSLRVISLMVLADSIYIILIFFAEKCE